MRVVVPATPTGLHPTVLPAILESGWAAHVEPMTYTEAYFDLLSRLWADRIDFAIVEHDVQIGPEVLDRFDQCERPWCAHSYEVYAGDVAAAYGGPFALGCVRFRAELMTEFPDVLVEAGKMDIHPVHPPKSYGVMDSTMTQWLRGVCRQKVHQHAPNVTHHHQYVRANTFPAWEPPSVTSPSDVESPL